MDKVDGAIWQCISSIWVSLLWQTRARKMLLGIPCDPSMCAPRDRLSVPQQEEVMKYENRNDAAAPRPGVAITQARATLKTLGASIE